MGVTLNHVPLQNIAFLHVQKVGWKTWLDQVNEDAIEWADEAELCESFDQFMREHGMRHRRNDFKVTLRVSFDVNVLVNARDADYARAEVAEGECDIVGECLSFIRNALGGEHWDIIDVRECAV